MSTQQVLPEQFAQLFHRYQQALENDPEGTHDQALPAWHEVPEEERTRLVDATRLALREMEIIGREAKKREDSYFAKPARPHGDVKDMPCAAPDLQRLTAGSMLGKDELSPLLTHRQPRSRKHPYQGKLNADAIEAGDFSIDLATRSVTVRGQTLELTSAEFEMLVFLTGHHKSVVTPNTMLAANWSRREIGQADFVRVLVSLRKKLDSITGSTPSYIRTESWIFYNFSPTLAHRV